MYCDKGRFNTFYFTHDSKCYCDCSHLVTRLSNFDCDKGKGNSLISSIVNSEFYNDRDCDSNCDLHM